VEFNVVRDRESIGSVSVSNVTEIKEERNVVKGTGALYTVGGQV